jgi:hypothetical protein
VPGEWATHVQSPAPPAGVGAPALGVAPYDGTLEHEIRCDEP